MIKPKSGALRWSTLLPRLAHYLPANQFNHLLTLPEQLETFKANEYPHIVEALLQVRKMLHPLHRVLVQYMPRYLIALDPTPGQPHGELLEGSFIFADVTGFTALTELLARQGQARGREVMNQIMNHLFTEILDPLIASGGDLLIFAGDAALVFFPKQDNKGDILQATRAALRMERAIAPFESFETEYGQCSLTMSAGVEQGTVYAGVVGTQQRMELLVSGPAIDRAMAAEVQAKPGQVMLGPQAQAVAQNHFTIQNSQVIDDLGDDLGDYEISLPTRKRGSSFIFGMTMPEVLNTISASLGRVEKLAPFLPEDMLAHLVNTEQRVRQLVSEFRPVALQFIHIVGLENLAIKHGADFATEVFQNYFTRAQEIISQHEGIISQIDAYNGGFFLLNTFGTPKVHEGTTRYAVSAALQLDKLLQHINQEFELDAPLQHRGGITYGLVFNGEIGAKYRRESVVMGPAVNRAARLMSKAEFGQVILDAKIWEDTRTAFVGEELPAVHLKGIEGPVVIINVREIRFGTRLRSLERPLLGRQEEQAKLGQALRALSELTQNSAWMVHGETGIGKTALILDLAAKARPKDVNFLVGRCQPHSKHIPLFVWIDLLTGWLDVDEQVDPAQQRARLTQELTALDMLEAEKFILNLLELTETETPSASATNKTQRLSLADMGDETTVSEATSTAPSQPQGTLNALLGSRVSKHRERSEKTLWTRLEERISGLQVILKLVQNLVRQKPMLIILEDIHWLDRDSESLLKVMLSEISDLPLMIVLTGRQQINNESTSTIALPGLSDSALVQVVQRIFGAQSLDETLAEWVCNQANGNPLYAEELCHALQQDDAVLLDWNSGEVRWTKQAPALPLSLHELMLARLDELSLPQQDLLKRAAVIGVSFEYEGLLHLYSNGNQEKEVESLLQSVIRAGFVTEIQAEFYQFSHPLMQEAIYTTLSFSQRQAWHAQIGDWLIERHLEHHVELIAYHCLHGSDAQTGAKFGLLAGNRARKNGVYAGALEYYQQVLALENTSPESKLAAVEGMADVLALWGDFSGATKAYTQAIELGSHIASQKQAIISGNLALLNQTEFSAELKTWAEVSKAYLLALEGDHKAALEIIQAASVSSYYTNDKIIKSLIKRLENNKSLKPYEQWVQDFTQIALITPST